MKSWLKVGLMAGLVAVITLHPTKTFECGGSSPEPVFVTENPENFEDFMDGNLGVVRPSFSAQNLFVAYRTLEGVPLNASERESLRTSLKEENGFDYYADDQKGNPYLQERSKISPASYAQIFRFKHTKEYSDYLNCGSDAFETAAATLRQRIAQFGKDSHEVRDWVLAQDKVFANCHSETAVIPDAAPADAPAVLKADREYQIASANFYGENYDEAAQLFQKIAADRNSQWHDWGLYLAARSYIRKGTVNPATVKIGNESLAKAEELLNKVASDATLPEMKPRAESLLGFVWYRRYPQQRLEQLGELIGKPSTNPQFHQNVKDYLALIKQTRGENDAMADWIMGMRGTDLEVKPVDRWRKQPKSLPWLVAALTTATGKSDGAQELVEAGLKVPPQSPAFETARYHSVRLISEQGHRAQARKLIDEFFKAKPERLTPSTANLMLAVRTTDAASLEDFARFSERQVVATNDYYMDPGDKLCSEGGQCPAAMPDRESSKVINHLPMASLIQLANMQAAPANVRDKAGRVAFIRALMLNDDASLVQSAEALSKSQKLGKDVQQILAAKTSYQRRVEAVLTVLRWPFRTYTIEPQYLGIDEGLTAGDESGGWWCDEAREQTAAANSSVRRATEGYPAFLSESERSVAEKQMAQLLKTQAAPDLFGEVLLGWARHSPDDPRVPEGLRSVVRAVHFGCGGPKAAEYAKSAFELLHRKYPTSEAAQKTKYWFPPR